LELTTNLSNYYRRVGQKTALLQAEVSACVSELVNVLFCGVTVPLFRFQLSVFKLQIVCCVSFHLAGNVLQV